MRFPRLTVPLLLLFTLGACTDYGQYGAIAVAWNFAGGNCDGAGVTHVQVVIAGEQLNPDTFDCRSGAVSFDNFYPGTYAVVVNGLDADGHQIWTGSDTVVVDGDTAVNVTLHPLSANNAVNYLSWVFDPATGNAPGCGAGQRLDSVALFIDGQDTQLSYNCGDGYNGGVVITPFLAPGDHEVQLVAYNAAEGQTNFAQTDPVTLHFSTGQAGSQTLSFYWMVGGLRMAWRPYASLADYQAQTPLSCAQAQLSGVEPALNDPNLPFGFYSCSAVADIDNLQPGAYTPYVTGYSGSSVTFIEDLQHVPQQVTITAGVFAPASVVVVPIFPVP